MSPEKLEKGVKIMRKEMYWELVVVLLVGALVLLGCGGEGVEKYEGPPSVLLINFTDEDPAIQKWLKREAKEFGRAEVYQATDPNSAYQSLTVARDKNPRLIYLYGDFSYGDQIYLKKGTSIPLSGIKSTLGNAPQFVVLDGSRSDALAQTLANDYRLVLSAITVRDSVSGIVGSPPLFGGLFLKHLREGDTVRGAWEKVVGDPSLPVPDRQAELAAQEAWKEMGYPTHLAYPEPQAYGGEGMTQLWNWPPMEWQNYR